MASTANNPTRIALIGVGGIGASHLTAIDHLTAEGRVRLVAVADPGAEKLAAKKAELETRGTRWYTSYSSLLEHAADLDAVIIATPIPFHYEMTRACLDHGLFVHLEKPPVPLIQQLSDLIKRDAHRRVNVAFQHVSSRAVRDLKERLLQGEFGSLREVRATACWPRLDSYYSRAFWAGKMSVDSEPIFDGPATNALSHLLHTIMFLTGESLPAFDVPEEIRGELYRVRPIESYDTACVRGKLASGVVFTAALTHATADHRPWRMEIRGSRGSAFIFENSAQINDGGGAQIALSSFGDTFVQSHRDFIDFVQGRAERAVTRLEDARGYVLTTNGMLISSGGIRDIDPALSCVYEAKAGEDHGYDFPGLSAVIDRTFNEGTLFSESGAHWAVETETVDVRNLASIPFDQYLFVQSS